MTHEPLSQYAVTILGHIAVRPVRCDKLIPALRDVFLERALIHATVCVRDHVYEITNAGKRLLAEARP